MKRLLSCLAALLVVLSASAQHTVADNIVWGYRLEPTFDGDDNVKAIGTGSAGNYEVGIKIPADGMFNGATISGVRLPIRSAEVITAAAVKVYGSDKKSVLTEQSVDLSLLADMSYCDVRLDNPVVMQGDAYVAFVFTTKGSSDKAKNPILYDKRTKEKESFLLKSGSSFSDYSSYYGAYILQVQMANATLTDYTATFSPVKGVKTRQDVENTIDFVVSSDGAVAVTDVDYTISVAGQAKETRHASLSIPAGLKQEATLPVAFTAPHELGEYQVEMAITKINGQDNAKAAETTVSTFENISRIDRMVVMEEFTGTDCLYCPRGWAGLEKARKAYPDRFIGLSIHQYPNDPMNYYEYPTLGGNSVPRGYFNRNGGDVYEGILKNVEKYMNETTNVELSATASFTDESRSSVAINAQVMSLVPATYELVYVLVADGLKGTKFVQTNYYYSFDAGSFSDDPDDPMAKFCKGGIYGTYYCWPVYNDVVIGSSYDWSGNQGGSLTLQKEQTLNKAYTVAMPKSADSPDLCEAIANAQYDVYAVVFALNNFGFIANGCRVKVENTTGSSQDTFGVLAPTEDTCYSPDGKRISENAKGVNIIRMNDGSVRKIMVK